MRYTDEIPVYMTFEETSLELDSVILFHPKKKHYTTMISGATYW